MILDTNAVSAILAGDESLAQVLQVAVRHHVPAIVLGEYRYGLKRSRNERTMNRLLARLEQGSTVVHVDGDTAKHYADVRHGLRERGRPIPENDVWIAALAAQHRLPIVSRDHDFDAIDEVQRIAW